MTQLPSRPESRIVGHVVIMTHMPMTQQFVPVPPAESPHAPQSVFARHELGHERPPDPLPDELPAPDELPLPLPEEPPED